MTKNFKLVLALALAAMMIASMIPAMAATSHTITVKPIANQNGAHTYTAYQVFSGKYDATAQNLSNIDWGSDVEGAAILTALKADTTHFQIDNPEYNADTNPSAAQKINAFASASSAADVAKALGANAGNGSDFAKAFADVVGANLKNTATGKSATQESKTSNAVITVDDDGYYFVKDTTTNVPEGDSRTDYILYVCANVEVTTKAGTVTSDKGVDDQNDSDSTDSYSAKESADYDIGDDIPYTLTFTLPADYANYKKYTVSFVDDMSAGLTYNNDAKIWYGEVTGEGTDISSNFAVDNNETSAYTTPSAGKVYKYTIDDLKTGTEAQKAMTAGQTITIKYTAKLNANAVVGSAGNPNKYQVIYSRNPNEEGTPETGTTPWDVNIVFTYKTVFNKVDGENKPLTGADFRLDKFIVNADGADSYNSTKGTWTDVTKLHGEGNDKVNPTKTTENVTSGETTVSNAKFTFAGLDAGVYRLTETTTPDGYNTIDPIIFTITATHELETDDPKLTALTGTDGAQFNMTAVEDTNNKPTGELDADVKNEKGAQLPSTGGIGTTIFYVAGSIMVLAAAILLITKRRMGAND